MFYRIPLRTGTPVVRFKICQETRIFNYLFSEIRPQKSPLRYPGHGTGTGAMTGNQRFRIIQLSYLSTLSLTLPTTPTIGQVPTMENSHG